MTRNWFLMIWKCTDYTKQGVMIWDKNKVKKPTGNSSLILLLETLSSAKKAAPKKGLNFTVKPSAITEK
jgi:hypothetical protein